VEMLWCFPSHNSFIPNTKKVRGKNKKEKKVRAYVGGFWPLIGLNCVGGHALLVIIQEKAYLFCKEHHGKEKGGKKATGSSSIPC